jgi:hypothetical protein
MIALSQPQITQVTNLLVVSIDIRFGADDSGTLPTLTYIACDANGTPLQGATPMLIRLTAADVLAFFQGTGSLRQRAQLALQSNLGAAGAGTVT